MAFLYKEIFDMNYVSPVKDTKFVLENLLNNPSAIESDLMNSILEEAGKLANENLAPLNHEGDKNPPKLRQDLSLIHI